MEDVMDAEDHLHRISHASTPGMGSAAREVSPEFYTYTGGEPRAFLEANHVREQTAQATSEEKAPPKKLATEEPAPEGESKVTSNASGEDQHAPKSDAAGTSASAETKDPSPTPGAAEQKADEDTHTSEAGRPPTMRFAGSPMPQSHSFQSPMGPWAHPHPAFGGGMPVPPPYRPFYPPGMMPMPMPMPPMPSMPPMPPMSPPPFGMPRPPIMSPKGQMARLEARLMSGYELLASRLAEGSESDFPVPPIYRRFKEFRHRIMVDLSDEISALEEKMKQLDDLDSENRRYGDGFLPASRRLDESEPNEVTTTRRQIRDHASNKLLQYSTQLDMYKKACKFRDALPEEIHDYRSFLATNAPIVPNEARFLDKAGDLMCLADPPYYLDMESMSDNHTPAARTPRLLEAPTAPNPMTVRGALEQAREAAAAAAARGGGTTTITTAATTNTGAAVGNGSTGRRPRPLSMAVLRHMMVGVCMAVILPILSFPVIAGFASRMTVVMLVGLGMAVLGVQSGAYDVLAGRASPVDGAAALGIYVGFMTIVALTFG
ncbi:hypothetical protein ISF_00466 [Cordyceps fumosorosea ARSEF 2679]|uniref:DUF6594 domain-containing protein n=1 Tax=Cordyceps fumosorosea (strain ARSEF 2679) TaxID=1081104 RepID=A0A168EA47_CORFA|nr:hypothetical protein ISF_00466 [Cordyceps fumosorosea ARSEF 2679]OAA73565.1 hypothetical protein ISF_00466 [Cordyceps fumosorosea ARSEF 2679]